MLRELYMTTLACRTWPSKRRAKSLACNPSYSPEGGRHAEKRTFSNDRIPLVSRPTVVSNSVQPLIAELCFVVAGRLSVRVRHAESNSFSDVGIRCLCTRAAAKRDRPPHRLQRHESLLRL